MNDGLIEHDRGGRDDRAISADRPRRVEADPRKGFVAFPPRLPEQPIFYPVLNEEYAIEIARDWNTKHGPSKCGYVTRFCVRSSFLRRYRIHTVGGSQHQEYWIPAEELNEFNQNIVGKIEVLSEFRG